MNRAPGLDLLRAAAIVWVMYYHAQIMDLVPDSDQVARFGWMGVDLFFALSGYLIGSQLFRPLAQGRTIDAGRFYARRALRTLPAYIAVVAVYFTVPAFRERPTIQPLWQFLTFTENLFIDFYGGKAFSHVWSLCVEEQFYLVVPVAAWWLARRGIAKTIQVQMLTRLSQPDSAAALDAADVLGEFHYVSSIPALGAALSNPQYRDTIRFSGEKIIPFLREAGLVGGPGMYWWKQSFLV